MRSDIRDRRMDRGGDEGERRTWDEARSLLQKIVTPDHWRNRRNKWMEKFYIRMKDIDLRTTIPRRDFLNGIKVSRS